MSGGSERSARFLEAIMALGVEVVKPLRALLVTKLGRRLRAQSRGWNLQTSGLEWSDVKRVLEHAKLDNLAALGLVAEDNEEDLASDLREGLKAAKGVLTGGMKATATKRKRSTLPTAAARLNLLADRFFLDTVLRLRDVGEDAQTWVATEEACDVLGRLHFGLARVSFGPILRQHRLSLANVAPHLSTDLMWYATTSAPLLRSLASPFLPSYALRSSSISSSPLPQVPSHHRATWLSARSTMPYILFPRLYLALTFACPLLLTARARLMCTMW